MAKFVEELEHLTLTPDQESRLLNTLVSEFDKAESERMGFIDNLEEEIEAYEAKKAPETGHPWHGSARITVPLIGSMADSIFPRVHATIFGASNVISIEEWPSNLADNAKAWEDFLQWSLDHELDLENVCDSWIMESIVHGTSIVKVYWERLERVIRTYDDEGNLVKKQVVVETNQPVLEHVPLEDFYIRMTEKSIDKAQWVAHRIRTNWGDIRLREENGLYINVEDIHHSVESEEQDYRRKRSELEDAEPTDIQEYELLEFWINFDMDGMGLEEPLLVTFHRPSHTLLRVQPNPYRHRSKPFREIKYFPRADRFYGLGLARQLMPLQEEISTLHRQRLDNSTIANTRMWKVVAGSRADHSFQGPAPGLKVLVDDMNEMDAMAMGDVGTSTFENETLALQYAQRRSGETDFLQGIDMGKTSGRQTATQSVAQMQEARTRFNWTLEQVRSAIADVASMVTDLYQQFGSEEEERFELVLGDRADLVTELLQGGDDFSDARLSTSLGLQVTATSATSNKAVEQQALIAMSQMLQQQTLQFEMPLIQIMMDPNAPQFVKDYAKERIEGSRVLMRRILETGDVRNTSQILGDSEDLQPDDAPPAPAAAPGPGPLIGGPPGAAPPSGFEGLAGAGDPLSGGVALGG